MSDDRCYCPACGGDLYRGTHYGQPMYKCMTANRCRFSAKPIGRTKAEVRKVNSLLEDYD